MGIPTELLFEIDSFLRKTGMAESTFGRKVANDGKLVARLRNGKGITTKTLEKIRDFIITNGTNLLLPSEANEDVLNRIADALERIAPPAQKGNKLIDSDAFVWHADGQFLEAIYKVSRVEILLLKGIDEQIELLMANTRRVADGLPSNTALLWGARGTGKSSLVKAAHAQVNADTPNRLALIEIHREDIPSLPKLLTLLRDSGKQCLLFCDDLSFEGSDDTFKSLKAVLEGGIEGRPQNVLFYATSNRRHLMPRDMIENEHSTAINPAEGVEEKVSLSDRFGLWLGFHNCDQDTFFAIVEGYAEHFNLFNKDIDIRAEAIEWSMTRGSRSGRVAWQFIQDLAGRLGKPLV
jgi:predicted AAA+ superfamily ATPase